MIVQIFRYKILDPIMPAYVNAGVVGGVVYLEADDSQVTNKETNQILQK